MKPSNKNVLFVFPLIIMLATTGCIATKTGKNANNESLLEGKELVLQKTGHLPEPAKLSSQNSNEIQTGRYSSISPKPTHAQRELLQVIIAVSIPAEITSIEQTIRYLLKRSGYQLVQAQAQQTELTEFLSKRLPDVHRHIGPMTLEDALTILTAPAFTLHEDPVHRLISYQLNQRYAGEIK